MHHGHWHVWPVTRFTVSITYVCGLPAKLEILATNGDGFCLRCFKGTSLSWKEMTPCQPVYGRERKEASIRRPSTSVLRSTQNLRIGILVLAGLRVCSVCSVRLTHDFLIWTRLTGTRSPRSASALACHRDRERMKWLRRWRAWSSTLHFWAGIIACEGR